MDDKINPGWHRPDDWKYEEDWNSPAWRLRMQKVNSEIRELREKYGFIKCPQCETEHTSKTICCRECGYKTNLTEGGEN